MKLLIEMSHQNGITFILVTHDRELSRYADRIITLMDGKVISDEINQHPAYLDDNSTIDKITAPPDEHIDLTVVHGEEIKDLVDEECYMSDTESVSVKQETATGGNC